MEGKIHKFFTSSISLLTFSAKDLSAEEKEYYEREAEKQNAMDSEEQENVDNAAKIEADPARFSPVASRGVGSRHDTGPQHDRSRMEAMGMQHGMHEGALPPDAMHRQDPYMRHDHLTLPRHDSRYGPAPHLMHQYVHPQNYVNPNPNYHGQGHHYPPHSPSHISQRNHPQHRHNNSSGMG